MQERIAQIGIIVEDLTVASRLNDILHFYSKYIIGRMGLPNHKGVAVISVVFDAPADVISEAAGRLGMLPGVSIKTVFPKILK